MAGDGSVDGGQHQHQQPHLMNAGNSSPFVYPQQVPWGGSGGARGPSRPLPGTDMGFGGGGPMPSPQQAAQQGGQGPTRMGVGGGSRVLDSSGQGLAPVPAGK